MNTENEAEFDYSISENIECRIQDDLEVYEGHLPERFSIAWKAYVTGLMEWRVIDLTNYKKLLSLLPAIANDPSSRYFFVKRKSKCWFR